MTELRRFPGGAAEPGVAGFDDGLGAVGDLEFGEDVGYVVADGFGAEEQLAGDVGVAAALGEQRQDLAFAFGQFGECGLLPRRGAGEVVQDPLRDGGAEDGFAVGDAADGPFDLLFAGAFEQVAAGAGAHRLEDGGVVVEHGQDQDVDVGAGLGERAGGVDAVAFGHVDVHDQHVWLKLFGQLDGLLAGGGLGDHLDAGQGAKGEAQPLPDHGVVVGDDDGRRLGHDVVSAVVTGRSARSTAVTVSGSAGCGVGIGPLRGSWADTMLPPPGRGRTVQLPPSSSARSRIEVRPTPARGPGPAPRPSSVTSTRSMPSPVVSVTVAVRAPAWRVTLVTASAAIR